MVSPSAIASPSHTSVPSPLTSIPPGSPGTKSFSSTESNSLHTPAYSTNSARNTSPSPRNFLKKWLTPLKNNLSVNTTANTTLTSGNYCKTEKHNSGGSGHPLNKLGNKLSLPLRRRKVRAGVDAASMSPTPRPLSLPIISNHEKNENKRTAECDESSPLATTKSPVKIRVLQASPYRSRYQEMSPYKSKWDSGEIKCVKSLDKKTETSSSFASAITPKVINHSPFKENLIPLSASRPFPYPGKYPRTINGYCGIKPVYDSDKVLISTTDDMCVTDRKHLEVKRRAAINKRRRSRSHTPDRRFLTKQTSSTENIYATTPHRLKLRAARSPNNSFDSPPPSITSISPASMSRVSFNSSVASSSSDVSSGVRSPDSRTECCSSSRLASSPGSCSKSSSHVEEEFQTIWRPEKLWGRKRSTYASGTPVGRMTSRLATDF